MPVVAPYYDAETGEGPRVPVSTEAMWQIIGDYDEYSCSTLNLISKYLKAMDILRDGVRLKRVINNQYGDSYTDLFSDELNDSEFKIFPSSNVLPVREHLYKINNNVVMPDEFVSILPDDEYETYIDLGGNELISLVENDIIGLVEVPVEIKGELVPHKFYLTEANKWIEWFNNNKDRNEGACCTKKNEWEMRGGEQMLGFLTGLVSVYNEKISMWQDRVRLGKVKPPVVTFTALLIQNYDDLGVMTPTDDEADYNGNETGTTETEGSTFTNESMLQTLRTKATLYGENGYALPYINSDTGIPYKVNEVFNVSYKADTNQYFGDFVREIRFYNVDNELVRKEYIGEISGDVLVWDNDANHTATRVEFAYSIGEECYLNKTKNISLATSGSHILPSSGGTFTIDLSANTSWSVVSKSKWLTIDPSDKSGTAGEYSISVSFGENSSFTENKFGTFVIGTSGDTAYEEARIDFMQEHQEKPAPELWVASTTKSVLVGYPTTIGVSSSTSHWCVVSKTGWLSITPTYAEEISNPNSVSVTLNDVNGGSIIFGLIEEPSVTKQVQIRESGMRIGVDCEEDFIVRYETVRAEIYVSYNGTKHNIALSAWDYTVINGEEYITLNKVFSNSKSYLDITNSNPPFRSVNATIRVFLKNGDSSVYKYDFVIQLGSRPSTQPGR